MNNDNKVPKIRFKGFTEDWEQRKFDEMADYKKGPFGSALKKDIFVPKNKNTVKVYEQQNAINKNWKLERYFITKDYANQLKSFETHAGDIIISCAGTIGEIYELPSNSESGIINQALMRVRVNEKIISKDLYKIIFSNMIDDFSKEHSNGSAMKNIPPFSDLKPMVALIPNAIEQERISTLMTNIDNLITLHQRKYDKLVNMKKSMLEKMFPKNFSNIPEIRFKGFADVWEQRKLNEISRYKASNLSTSDAKVEATYDLYDANGIVGKINSEILKEEYITIIKDGSGVGKVRRLPKNTAFIGTMGGILSKESDIDFIYYSLQRTDFSKEINGATIPHIYYSNYGNNEYFVPKIKEQEQIGMLFANIDNLITLHQRKLEKLNNMKKAMLEKMFV